MNASRFDQIGYLPTLLGLRLALICIALARYLKEHP